MFYETRPVAGSKNYTINTFGEVFSASGERLEESFTPEGRPRVYLYIDKDYKWAYRQIARLMLQTFRPTTECTDMWSVRYKNGSILSVGLDNLEWDTSLFTPTQIPGVTVPWDAFVQIPDFPKYEINLKGDIRSIASKKVMSQSVRYNPAGKYRKYVALRKPGTDTVITFQVARYLALTFLPHPRDCEHLVVNHIDGNPENVALLNLEWVTVGRNNQHAFEEGLREGVREVLIKSVKTGEILKFPTIQKAAEHIGVKRNVLHVYLTAKIVDKAAPCNGWLVRYEGDPTPWDCERVRVEGEILALNLKTQTCQVIRTRKEAVGVTGIAETMLAILCREETPRPWKGWMVQMLGDRDPKTVTWPTYPQNVIDLFEQMTRKCNPVEVTHIPTGTSKLYLGVKYWWKDVDAGIDPAVLFRKLKISKIWRDWKFEFINLYDKTTGSKVYPVIE